MRNIDWLRIYGTEYYAIAISTSAIPEADYNDPVMTWDSQSNIDKCLCCSKPDCCNCLLVRHYKKSKKNRVDDTVLQQLVSEGLKSSAEIAEYFGVPLRTVQYHISKLSKLERCCV